MSSRLAECKWAFLAFFQLIKLCLSKPVAMFGNLLGRSAIAIFLATEGRGRAKNKNFLVLLPEANSILCTEEGANVGER